MEKKHSYILAALCGIMFLLSGCSDSSDDGGTGGSNDNNYATLDFAISAPVENSLSRAGDPGVPVDEAENWDKMSIFIAYTTDGGAEIPYEMNFYKKTLTKTEYENLPLYKGSDKIRILQLEVPVGHVYIYGLTYSDGADAGLESAISACNSKADVEALTISNDYAADDVDNQVSKFLSVATGYYKNDYGQAWFEIKKVNLPEFMPVMTLTRLAAKIDIQWDAQDAYPVYQDVKVETFRFNGDRTAVTTSTGKGRIFPDLYKGTEILNGSSDFFNTSAISKINGRVYHYVFPDGAGSPQITFHITAHSSATNVSKDYIFNFKDGLKLIQATWYKINTTIRGFDGTTDITIVPST